MPVTEVDHDTTTELDSIQELLAKDEAKRERAAAKAPSGFDPSCVFLLSQQPINLFEQIDGVPFKLRCKGCGRTVVLWNHQTHFNRHKKAHEQSVAAPATRNPPQTKFTEQEGDDVPKTLGPKEQQARDQREARAKERSQPQTPAATAAPKEKPKKAPKAASVAQSGSRADSLAISEKAVAAFTKKVKADKLGKVETKTNENVGYTSIKVNGVLVGYTWFTNKADLRVEAAISKSDMPDDDRVGPYKRSNTIQARTRIDAGGIDLAVQMWALAVAKTVKS